MTDTQAREHFRRWVSEIGGEAAGAAVGCTKSMVSLICAGKRTPSSLRLCQAIEDKTGIPAMAWLNRPSRRRAA